MQRTSTQLLESAEYNNGQDFTWELSQIPDFRDNSPSKPTDGRSHGDRESIPASDEENNYGTHDNAPMTETPAGPFTAHSFYPRQKKKSAEIPRQLSPSQRESTPVTMVHLLLVLRKKINYFSIEDYYEYVVQY